MSIGSEMANNAASLIIDHQISENNGDHVALRFRDKRYSYNDLAALMNRAGNMMRRLSVTAGDIVLIAVAPSPSLLASVFGAMKIGAVPMLVPSDASSQVIASLGEKQKPKMLIADAARVAKLHRPGQDITLVVVGEAAEGQRSFLQEMRESPSSLTKSAIANGAAALAVVQANESKLVSHAQLADARSEVPLAIQFEGWNLGGALGRFARGEEEIIA